MSYHIYKSRLADQRRVNYEFFTPVTPPTYPATRVTKKTITSCKFVRSVGQFVDQVGSQYEPEPLLSNDARIDVFILA